MQHDLIYDVGMHKGEDTAYYLGKGFRVVAVEANADLCELSRKKFSREIENGRLTIVDKAITETGGSVEFFINDDLSIWSTTARRYVERNTRIGTRSRPVMVAAVKFGDILHEHGVPYYMKVDIEGSDLLCLKALLEVGDRPTFISVEGGDISIDVIWQQFDLFGQLGYRKFKIVPQQHMDKQKCPFPSREGLYVDYTFEHGSSGPFGEEAPGNWISAEEAIEEYKRIFFAYRVVWTRPFQKFPVGKIKDQIERLFWRGFGWYDTHAKYDQS